MRAAFVEREMIVPVRKCEYCTRKEMNYAANCFVVDQNAPPAHKKGVDICGGY